MAQPQEEKLLSSTIKRLTNIYATNVRCIADISDALRQYERNNQMLLDELKDAIDNDDSEVDDNENGYDDVVRDEDGKVI